MMKDHISIKSIHQEPTMVFILEDVIFEINLEWKATAIGKNMKNAKTFLEKRYRADMELDDAVHTALLTLKEGFEGYISQDL